MTAESKSSLLLPLASVINFCALVFICLFFLRICDFFNKILFYFIFFFNFVQGCS